MSIFSGRRSSIASKRTEPSLASQSRSKPTSPQREKMNTAPRQWEEPSFTHRSRRKLSPATQKESSLTTRTDPPATQYDWEIDRSRPPVRARVRPELPSSPLHENMAPSRRNRASHHLMETPCIHIDSPRTSRPCHNSHRTAEFEAPLRTPTANSHRVGRDKTPPRKSLEFWSFVLFNDAWSQKGHSASNTTVILA